MGWIWKRQINSQYLEINYLQLVPPQPKLQSDIPSINLSQFPDCFFTKVYKSFLTTHKPKVSLFEDLKPHPCQSGAGSRGREEALCSPMLATGWALLALCPMLAEVGPMLPHRNQKFSPPLLNYLQHVIFSVPACPHSQSKTTRNAKCLCSAKIKFLRKKQR